MKTFEIKGDFWNSTKAKLKQHWSKHTEKDLQFNDGKTDALYARIQTRTGESLEAVERGVMQASTCGR